MKSKEVKTVREAKLPSDLKKAIVANKGVKEVWDDITPVARRDWIAWVITAKQKETRKQRIERLCEMMLGGKRRVCCFPGVKWMIKDKTISEEVRKQLKEMIE